MKNNFLNNNGVSLLNTKKSPKTKVEVQIERLKQQEQAMISELSSRETKQKKAERLNNYLDEVNRFSTKFLAEAVEVEKAKDSRDDWWLEHLIKNKVEFTFKFEASSKVFYRLIFQKTESQVRQLQSQLRDIQSQLAHQERIFARVEARRQGRTLLECELNERLGCLGSYQCANCRVNYSLADNNQAVEITK